MMSDVVVQPADQQRARDVLRLFGLTNLQGGTLVGDLYEAVASLIAAVRAEASEPCGACDGAIANAAMARAERDAAQAQVAALHDSLEHATNVLDALCLSPHVAAHTHQRAAFRQALTNTAAVATAHDECIRAESNEQLRLATEAVVEQSKRWVENESERVRAEERLLLKPYVRHEAGCAVGGGSDWREKDTEHCNCGLGAALGLRQ